MSIQRCGTSGKILGENSNTELILSWEGLNVWESCGQPPGMWRNNQRRIKILDNVCGSISSGTLTAIMGPSGAGKSTLLSAVSMRIREDNMSGEFMLNGNTVSKKFLSDISGFVPQQDIAFEALTVEEHLVFMAKMKMGLKTTTEIGEQKIHDIVQELSLSKSFKTMICCLSGGEKKKLALAVELLNDPPILFCDEPTTGLDSWAAISVVSQLRTLAAGGRAVLCVLHQPASGTYQLFDRLILLAGGRVAFSGQKDKARIFFTKHHFTCPVGYNESEFYVKVVSCQNQANSICTSWEYSERLRQNHEHHLNGHLELREGNVLFRPTSCSSFNIAPIMFDHTPIQKPGAFAQFRWLLWRLVAATKNDIHVHLTEFFALMIVAITVMLPFQGVFTDIDQRSIQNIQGLMYLIISETVFIFAYSVFYNFSSEVPIFLREVTSGLYTPGPYYLSKIIYMMPNAIVQPFFYSLFVYWSIGLKGGYVGFILFSVAVIFAANCANAYGSWLATTFESFETALLVAIPMDLISYLFSGNFINLASLSSGVAWLKYLSIFHYLTEAISILQWKEVDSISCETRTGLPCIRTGLEVLDFYGFGKNNYFYDLLGMFVLFICFHVLGFLSLTRRSKKQAVY